MMRLGKGELTMHYRRDDGRRRIECGRKDGCITSVLADVTCGTCRRVAALADEQAARCGCRRGTVHRGVARAVVELGEEHATL